ncbi:alanine racemase C-terminal domain-containing protein [Enterococcus faecalis]|uniref:alanine racemase C-terminal domain-containing protein n=1 Tax=Enterococcus faecalis TaxID=1351 RepID=UPI0021CBFC28|nr:alanine racemase C-terminal domain-containing protein [Enterococcus faecalis]
MPIAMQMAGCVSPRIYSAREWKRCEIVGRVCMDQCMIRLAEEVPVGSVVTLVGKDGNEENTLQMVAEKLETIHYEVACTFSQRIPREYN